MSAARDIGQEITGTGENYERDDDGVRERVARVSDRVRDVFRRGGTAPAEEDMDALNAEVSAGLEELAGVERRQFEETLIDKLGQFSELVIGSNLRAFILGGIFASVLWILAFIAVVVLLQLVSAHLRLP